MFALGLFLVMVGFWFGKVETWVVSSDFLYVLI